MQRSSGLADFVTFRARACFGQPVPAQWAYVRVEPVGDVALATAFLRHVDQTPRHCSEATSCPQAVAD